MSTKQTTKKQSKRVTPKKITSASEWIKDTDVKGRPLEVPSGKMCLVHKPEGLKAFMQDGSVPNFLLPILASALEGKHRSVEDLSDELDLSSSPDRLAQVFELADRTAINCVIEPKVHPVPRYEDGPRAGEVIPPHERPDDDKLYVDYITDEDKWFIFNYVMSGQTDLETFRAQLAENVAALQSGEGVGSAAKPDTQAR